MMNNKNLLKTIVAHYLRPIKNYKHPFWEHKYVTEEELNPRKYTTPQQFLAGKEDSYLLWLFSYGINFGYDSQIFLPKLPPTDMQRNWTGLHGEDALREAQNFYKIICEEAKKNSQPITSNTKILDFGCGWGRILRFFMREVEHTNLFGSDCYEDALKDAQLRNSWCQFSLNDIYPPMSYPNESFDIVYLYSVFSHLSETAHLQWVREFSRILKPSGLLVATTRTKEFILTCRELRENSANASQLKRSSMSFENTEEALASYDRGEFCHSPTGGGGPLEASFYGESCIPKQYVIKNWQKFGLALQTWRPANKKCPQNVIVCRKEIDPNP